MDPPILSTVRIDVDHEIAGVVLARGGQNAIDGAMILDLTTAFAWLADRAETSAVVVSGSDGDFCGGYDPDWVRGQVVGSEDPGAMINVAARFMNTVFIELRRIPIPTVAAVEGLAAGPGLSLALACDSRVVSNDATLSFDSDEMTSCPPAGSTFFLPRILSPARTLELLLEKPDLSGQAAKELGLATVAVPGDQLLRSARELALRQAAQGDVAELRKGLETRLGSRPDLSR